MKRWLLWLCAPIVLVIAAWLFARARLTPVNEVVGAVAVLLWGWIGITIVAVPVGIVRWLIVGARARRRVEG